MEVRCERCSSLYDFDESRVPAEGLSVKCSTCGHVFRVFRPGAAAPGVPGVLAAVADDWLLRQATSGKLVRFKDMAALQRWIVERRVRRDDELSRGGKDWRRLGDLPDLVPFFKAIEAQAPVAVTGSPASPYGSGAFPAQGTTGTFPMPGAGAFTVPAAPAPQGAVPTTGPLFPPLGGPAPAAAAPALAAPVAPPPQPGFVPPPQPGLVPPPGQPGARWEGSPQSLPQVTTGSWQLGNAPPGSMPLPTFAGGPQPDADDDLRPRGGKARWIVLGLVVLLAAAAGGVWTLRPDLVKKLIGPRVNEAAVQQVSAAHAELRKDSDAAVERARGAFEQAIALDPEYAAAHAGLAQAELARADALLEAVARRQAAAAAAQPDPAVTAELEQRHKEAQAHLDRGHAEAQRALELSPDGPEGLRAMAEWNRLTGKVEAVKPLLDQARLKAPGDAWVAFTSGASFAGDPALAERAIRHFDEALEAAPDLNIARYHLARLYLAQDNKAKAKEHAEKILAAVPDHERAKALVTELEPPPPPPAAEPAPEAAPAPAAEAPKELGYDALFARGDRLRQNDRPREALKLFEKAAEINATDPEVYNAMGLCYLDMEAYDAAIANFGRALTLVPRFSDAHFGIAQAYQAKGQRQNAVKHYKAYLDLVPDGEDAEVAKRALSELQQ